MNVKAKKPRFLTKTDGEKPPVFDITYFNMKSKEIQDRFETVVKTNKTVAACVELAKQNRITWTDALKLAITRVDKDYEYLYAGEQKKLSSNNIKLDPNSFYSNLFQVLPHKNKFIVMSLIHNNLYFSDRFHQKGEEHEVITITTKGNEFLLGSRIEYACLFATVADAEDAIKNHIISKLQ